MAVKIFLCYAHEDQRLLRKLKSHLRPFQRQGLIDAWHDQEINAGTEWEREISEHLNTAQIVLLLISPDFMDSDYCYSIEMKRALERHERGEAKVIPVIMRPVHWEGTPISGLQVLPTEGKPVTKWRNRDDALADITKGILKVVEELNVNSITNSLPSSNIDIEEPNEAPPLQDKSQSEQQTSEHSFQSSEPSTEEPRQNSQTSEQCLLVSQTLKKLADQIATSDWHAATQFRSLSEAVIGNPAADKWITTDISRIIDPDIIVEHFKNRSVTVKHGTYTHINILRLLRNALIFAPVIVTLFGISQAVVNYNKLVEMDPSQAAIPFLLLWQQGFYGRLPFFLNLSGIIFLDAISVMLIFILTYISSFLELTIKQAIQNRKEREARQLHAEIVQALEHALHCLPLK